MEPYINEAYGEEEKQIIEELSATNRLLTDLTSAGSWTINFAPDGSVASVQWGDGLRRLMGYSSKSDFPDKLESFIQGIYPEDKAEFLADKRNSTRVTDAVFMILRDFLEILREGEKDILFPSDVILV